jgi:hypothetical protein
MSAAIEGGRMRLPPLRIAVFHHPITGNEKMEQDAFMERLRNKGVEICLHGHVHEERAELFGYTHPHGLIGRGIVEAFTRFDSGPNTTRTRRLGESRERT